MQGVGPGSLLGGRYLVSQRVARHYRYERWSAADQTLDRAVMLLCFDADGPVASPALDAARRAAGVEDHRLVRVLDVGRDDAVAFVVEEPLTGGRSIAESLDDGALPADEARRIAGEAASALESARARGLHHGVLTPRSVLRLRDGSVKVRGVAIEAALVEADDATPEEATRADAIALVGLLYACLTARWPLTGADPGLQAAPRVAGGVAPPSEIAAGVPADLDRLARTTLNEDRGPGTPGELAEQLSPWAGGLGAGLPSGRRPPPGTRTEPLDRHRATGAVASRRSHAHPAASGAAPAQAGVAGATGLAEAERLRAVRGGSNGPTAGGTGNGVPGASPAASTSESEGTGRRETLRSILGIGVDSGANGDARGDPEGRAETDGGEAYEFEGDGMSGRPGTGAALAGSATAGSAAVAKGIGSALEAAGGLAGALTGKVGGLARTAADRAAERSAIRAERRQAEQYEDPLVFGEDVRLSDTLETTEEQLEPALPLLPGAVQEPLDRNQSRAALLIVVAFVLIAAVLGIWGLPKLSGIGLSVAPTPVVTKTVTATPGNAAAAAPGTSAPAPSAPPAPIAIAGASQISADAGVQASRTAALAYDGNPDTVWTASKWFGSPDYGGYTDHEEGLLLQLDQAADIHSVKFSVVGPADVTVYVANKPSISGATEIGQVTGQDGETTVTVANGGAVNGDRVILWFTSLGPDSQTKGHFRAQVGDVSIS